MRNPAAGSSSGLGEAAILSPSQRRNRLGPPHPSQLRGRVKRSEILRELDGYASRHPDESAQLQRFRSLLRETSAPFSREQWDPGHITLSACVLSPDAACVLLLHHAKLKRWLQPGGHGEASDSSGLAGALREAREESGLGSLRARDASAAVCPVDIDIHRIPAHAGEPAHLHFDLRYAMLAERAREPLISPESQAVRWVRVRELRRFTDEESVTRLVERSLTT